MTTSILFLSLAIIATITIIVITTIIQTLTIPTTINNHIRLEPDHVLTQCLYEHEIIIDLYIGHILLRKVFAG